MPWHAGTFTLTLQDVERYLLDKEITELDEKLQILRAKRNRLSPISSLPPELLTRIFSFVQRQTYWDAYEWTAVTHVCQDWRIHALGTATLWRRIVHDSSYPRPRNGSQPAALTILQRSGKCKLDVDVYQSYTLPRDLTLLFTILAELPRIKTLRLSLRPESYCMDSPELQKLALILCNPAPVLEEFRFSSLILTSGEEGMHRLGFDNDLVWFNGVSPQLRSIILSFSPSDLVGLHGQNLTNLELRNTGQSRVSFSALLDLLSEAKGLKTISLDHAFSFEGGTPIQPISSRVSLGALSSSDLSFDLPELVYFLTTIAVPSTSQTTLRITSIGELHELLEALSDHFLDAMRPVSSMTYCLEDGSRLDLELRAAFPTHSSEPYISILFPLDTHAPLSGLNALPLSQMHTLLLARHDDNIELPEALEVFGWCRALDHLTNLALEDAFVDLFINFAQENIDIFPALETFAACLSHGEESYRIGVLDSLYQIFERRASFHKPMKLRKLLLANLGAYGASSPIDEKINKFRGLVSEMQVGEENIW
ncbi:hypothetical protein BDN72DRAFT_839407 [Pluteus cervinus]|uniref:Uncharacterized protein n=1 Tax=Pluteus cervinus TaxID=181527 RepID=A0ACD3AW27_9AGAR|nr:hypothetical protein BDN72DRAFT_839407 [Pluteus cervinus]